MGDTKRIKGVQRARGTKSCFYPRRVMIYLNPEQVEVLDVWAKKLNMSRNATIRFMLSQIKFKGAPEFPDKRLNDERYG